MEQYSLYDSPVGFDFRRMTRREAHQYFDHFVGNISDRIRMLSHRIQDTPGFNTWSPDWSDQSIELLSRWLETVAASDDLTNDDRELLRSMARGPLRNVTDQLCVKLTNETYSYCFDSAMYFGETLRRRHSVLEWKIGPKPVYGLFYNRPVLATHDGRFMTEPFELVHGLVGRFIQTRRQIDLVALLADEEFQIRGRF